MMWQLLQNTDRDVYHPAQNINTKRSRTKAPSTAASLNKIWRIFRPTSGMASRPALSAIRILKRHRLLFRDLFLADPPDESFGSCDAAPVLSIDPL